MEDAVYGGEMSSHHYFRDFFYCDSGMIPWLLVVEVLGRSGHSLSRLVDKMIADYPSPGEINCQIANPSAAIERVRNHYQEFAHDLDKTDGLSMEFAEWRFNLRSSNTEPVVRLNIETRGNTALMAQQRDAILKLLDAT